MLSNRRLWQLKALAESHPHYFRHNYLRELANAGYEEIAPNVEPVKQSSDAPKGHGKKALSGASLVKAKPQSSDSSAKEGRTRAANSL